MVGIEAAEKIKLKKILKENGKRGVGVDKNLPEETNSFNFSTIGLKTFFNGYI